MNLARFFQVTAIFLLVFVVQLLIYGFHELAEANVLPNSEALHWATEPYGPDGTYGQYLTYLLVALPLGWLALSSIFGKHQGPRSQAAVIFRLKAEATQRSSAREDPVASAFRRKTSGRIPASTPA